MAKVSDVKRKDIPITLSDGKPRYLKFTLNSFAELEDKFGSVDIAFEKLEKENSMKALRAVLWAGLLHEDPPLSEQEVGGLIDIAYMQDLVSTIGGVLEQDLPEPEDELKLVDKNPNE